MTFLLSCTQCCRGAFATCNAVSVPNSLDLLLICLLMFLFQMTADGVSNTWTIPSPAVSFVSAISPEKKHNNLILIILFLMFSMYDRLRNDLYCVEWGIKLYSLTHARLIRKAAQLYDFVVDGSWTALVFVAMYGVYHLYNVVNLLSEQIEYWNALCPKAKSQAESCPVYSAMW